MTNAEIRLDGFLHGGAVDVGDFLALGQRRGERLEGVGVLLRPRLRHRVALDREVLGGALVEIGQFFEAGALLVEADERFGGERGADGVGAQRVPRRREGHVVIELHLVGGDAMLDEQRVDQQGADVVLRVDRDRPALELADRADSRPALDEQRQDVRLQEGRLGDDPQPRGARYLVVDVGDVVPGGDVVSVLELAVDQVLGGGRDLSHRHDLHVQTLGGKQAVHLGDVQAGRVDGRERVDDDAGLLERELRRAGTGPAGAPCGEHRDRDRRCDEHVPGFHPCSNRKCGVRFLLRGRLGERQDR